VFSYLSDAKERRPGLEREIDRIYDWFVRWLDAPTQLDIERFWFKAEAWSYVWRARELSTLVREAGIPIVERRIRRVPGIVRWEDREQVAVVTFRDTPRVATTVRQRGQIISAARPRRDAGADRGDGAWWRDTTMTAPCCRPC
jgi:hypothetical protein